MSYEILFTVNKFLLGGRWRENSSYIKRVCLSIPIFCALHDILFKHKKKARVQVFTDVFTVMNVHFFMTHMYNTYDFISCDLPLCLFIDHNLLLFLSPLHPTKRKLVWNLVSQHQKKLSFKPDAFVKFLLHLDF